MNGEVISGRFIKATTANGMTMMPMGETVSDGLMYQLQIYARYKIESEEL